MDKIVMALPYDSKKYTIKVGCIQSKTISGTEDSLSFQVAGIKRYITVSKSIQLN
jgi:hypothetical protein